MHHARARAALAIGAAAFGACGSSHHAKPDAHVADAPPAPDAELAKWSGSVLDYETQADIGAAKVCVAGHSEIACAMTDPAGGWALGIPIATTETFAVTVTAGGYLGGAVLAQGMGSQSASLPNVELMNAGVAATQLGTDGGFNATDASTGFLVVHVNSPNAAGATATLSPASGMGPVYGNTAGSPQKSLTSTSSSGEIFFGNVTPGTVAVTVSLTGKTCSALGSGSAVLGGDWPPTQAGTTVAAEIVAGALTEGVNVTCQ